MTTRLLSYVLIISSLGLSAQNCSTPITPDYFETFDNFLPNCWEEADEGNLTNGPSMIGLSDWTQEEFAHELQAGLGAVNINIRDLGVSDWLLTPTFDLSAGGYELNVDVALTDFDTTSADQMDSDDEVVLAYTLDGATWIALKTWNSSNQPDELGEVYTDELVTLNGESQVRFAFYASSGTVDGGQDYDFHIDNFSVALPPTCFDISNVVVLDVTDRTATINFDSGNEFSNGNFQYAVTPRLQGFPSAPTADLSDPSLPQNFPNATFTIGNGSTTGPALDPHTTYDLYVREQCSPGDFGEWSFPVVFTTRCNDIESAYPVSIDFANHIPNPCWSESPSGDLTTGPVNTGNSDWRGGRSYTDISGSVIPSNAIRLYQSDDDEWLMSEIYNLAGSDNDFLTVDVAVTSYQINGTSFESNTSNMGSDDAVYLLITEDGGNSWVILDTWDQNNRPLSTGSRSSYDISAYDGLAQFAFYATDGAVDDIGIDMDFHVGNFIIDATASSESLTLENAISLYPNPARSGNLYMNVNDFSSSIDTQIFDSTGKMILSDSFEPARDIELINVDRLSDGMYFVKISSDDQSHTFKFIKG